MIEREASRLGNKRINLKNRVRFLRVLLFFYVGKARRNRAFVSARDPGSTWRGEEEKTSPAQPGSTVDG